MNVHHTPLVTIGIPTYNRADSYLPEALQSALDQTYPKLEIVVSDNMSTDRTEAMLRDQKDSRVRYFRQATRLIANDNFNFCLQQANGEYFQLLHDDDKIDPDFIETCVKAVPQGKRTGIIRTGLRVIGEDGKVQYEQPNSAMGLSDRQFLEIWLKGQSPTFLCNTLFNTACLREIGGFRSKTNLYQDVAAELELGFKFGRTEIGEIKATFRRHSSNMGGASATMKWIEDSHYLLDKIQQLVPDLDEEFRRRCKFYLCQWNYSRVKKMRTLSGRLHGYYLNYKGFDYVNPPFGLIYRTELRDRFGWRRIRRRCKRLLGRRP